MQQHGPRPIGPMIVGALCALITLVGCQQYQPKPLDPQTHRLDWQARTAADQPVQAFADHLAELGDIAAQSFNPDDGLTLGEAELVALVFNPDLRIARLEAGVATATAEHAGQWDDPTLEAELLRITDNVSDPWIVASGLAITLPISGRLEVEKHRADAERSAALDRVAQAEWQMGFELQQAWLNYSAAVLREQAQRELIGTVKALAASTDKLAQAGEMPSTEAALFSIERSQRDYELRRIQGNRAVAQQQLRSLIGLSPQAPVEFVPALIRASQTSTADRATLGERNPTLILLSQEYEVAELVLQREIRKQIPDLTIGPAYENEDGQSKIGLTGGIPIPILNTNRQAIAQAKATRELARAAFETEYERLVGKHAETQARAVALQQERDLVMADTVPLIDKQLDDAQRLLAIGEGGGLVLLESIVRAHETKLHLIDLRRDESIAHAQLRFLAGPASSDPQPNTTPQPDSADEVQP